MAKKQATIEDVLKALNGRFNGLEGRFDKLEGRFDKLEVEVFKQGRDITEIKDDFGGIKHKVNHIYNVLDSHMKRIEEILQENKMRDIQQERLQQWIFQLANATDVKLKYEQ